MNAADIASWATAVGVLAGIVQLIRSTRQEARKRASDIKEAADKLRKNTLREGYELMFPVLDRVADILNGLMGTNAAPEQVERQVNRVLGIFEDAKTGGPDAD